MAIRFLCPACGKKIKVADVHAGKRGACPTCKEHVQIPASSQWAEEEEAPAGEASLQSAKRPEAPARAQTPVSSSEKEGKAVSSDTTVALPAMGSPETVVREAGEAFIKFHCPSCGKMTGFPKHMAGSPAPCPACRAKVMVPEKSGDISFILGASSSSTGPRLVKREDFEASRSSPDRNAVPAAQAPSAAPKPLVWVGACLVAGLVVGLVLVLLKGRAGPEAAAVQEGVRSAQAESRGAAQAASKSAPSGEGAKEISAPASTAPAAEPPWAVRPASPGKTAAVEVKTPKVEEQERPRAEEPPITESTPTEPPAPSKHVLSTPEPPLSRPPKPSDEEELEPQPSATSKKPRQEVSSTPAPAPPDPQAPVTPAPAHEVKPVAPAPLCPLCQGTRCVPNLPSRPYVWQASEPAPDPGLAVPWSFCSQCQRGRDPKELLEAEKARLAKAEGEQKTWQELTGLPLQYLETRHISLHAQLPPPMAKGVAVLLDKLAGHLQTVTRSTLLTQTRPDTHKILILWDTAGYNKLIDLFEKQRPGNDWALARKSTGGSGRNLGYFNASRGQPTGPEHMAIFQLSKMWMTEATDGHAPAWLEEGFASYCENVMTQMNLCYSFTYEKNEVRFGQNWDVDLKKLALQSKLKTWDYIFPLDLIGMKSIDYLTCYSMVSFFIKSDPKRFLELAVKIREGMESGKALEKIYNRPVKDLQMLWAQWAMR